MTSRVVVVLLVAGGVAGAQEPAPQQAYPQQPPPGYAAPPPGYYPPPPGYYPPAAQPAPPPEARPSSFQARLSMGAGLRALYDVSIYGGDIEIGLGAQPTPNLAFYGNIGFFLGRTGAGLATIGFRPGMMVEGAFDRFRIGGGVQFGSITIRRVTGSGTLDDFTIGPRINTSVDLTRWGRHGGLYVGLSASLDFLTASKTLRDVPLMVEGQLLLGARF